MRTVFFSALVLMAAACGNKDDAATVPPDTAAAATGAGGSDGVGGAGGDGVGGDGVGGGAGAEEDAGPDVENVPCGARSCNAGEYCCEGACGACAAVGTNCPIDPCGTGTDGAASVNDAANDAAAE